MYTISVMEKYRRANNLLILSYNYVHVGLNELNFCIIPLTLETKCKINVNWYTYAYMILRRKIGP